ncbi:GFA family protein [Pseudomonas sp. DWP1b1]|uniref:GFA family protein n=1 Tax=unclassified Pseudomonas TaxID=196821 RepID=UPI003CE9ABD7
MIFTGQCRCAAVTYQLELPTLPAIYACHCRHCQTWSGSAFALHALLPADALTVEGPLTEYAYDMEGQHSTHQLCARCHTRISNTTSAAPGLRVLRVGTLHDSPALAPAAHIWVSRKQPWLLLPDGVPCWPQSPTPEAFALALQD